MLFIIRGLPGSGKTTLAEKLKETGVIDDYFEADMFFTNEKGVYKYDSNRIKDAHVWCKRKIFQGLLEGKKVAVSNTFSRHWEFVDYIQFVKAVDISYTVIECKGNWKSKHVSEVIVETMRERWESGTPTDQSNRYLSGSVPDYTQPQTIPHYFQQQPRMPGGMFQQFPQPGMPMQPPGMSQQFPQPGMAMQPPSQEYGRNTVPPIPGFSPFQQHPAPNPTVNPPQQTDRKETKTSK